MSSPACRSRYSLSPEIPLPHELLSAPTCAPPPSTFACDEGPGDDTTDHHSIHLSLFSSPPQLKRRNDPQSPPPSAVNSPSVLPITALPSFQNSFPSSSHPGLQASRQDLVPPPPLTAQFVAGSSGFGENRLLCEPLFQPSPSSSPTRQASLAPSTAIPDVPSSAERPYLEEYENAYTAQLRALQRMQRIFTEKISHMKNNPRADAHPFVGELPYFERQLLNAELEIKALRQCRDGVRAEIAKIRS